MVTALLDPENEGAAVFWVVSNYTRSDTVDWDFVAKCSPDLRLNFQLPWEVENCQSFLNGSSCHHVPHAAVQMVLETCPFKH
jgi:siroheme synthase (precorrin-2 oxidase/ferrochelatase)